MAGYRNFYDEIDHFFADKKGRLFTALNYKGTQYGTALNTKENPDTIKAEPIFQLMLQKNCIGGGSETELSGEFVAFVKETAAHHKSLDTHLAGAAGEHMKKIAYVYQNWAALTADGRDFYTTFMNLVDKHNRTIAASTPGTSPITLTLNLTKVDPSNPNTETRFGCTLPYLPRGTTVGGVEVQPDYLHTLYDGELNRTTGAFVGGAAGDLFDGWTTLDQPKFLKSILYVQNQVSTGKLTVSTPLDQVYDLATDTLYTIKDGKLTNRDGVAIDDAYLDNELKSADAGTHVKSGDLVYQCLLSGDPEKLSRCLGKYSIDRMYDVARSEVEKMHPDVMRKVLKTFGIVEDKYGKVEEYLVWRGNFESRLVPKMGADKAGKTAQAVLNNKKLTEYLRNIMDVLRSVPRENTKETLSDLPKKTEGNIKYFIAPKTVRRADEIRSQIEFLTNQQLQLPQNFMSAVQMPLGVSNMSFGLPFMGGIMRGGAGCVDETVATMRELFENILKELRESGKDLAEEDKKHINEAIAQLEKNNKQLMQALNDLKAFMRLDRALTVGINEVRLADSKGASKISLEQQVKNLSSCIESTSANQQDLIRTLITKVFDPMAKLAAGIATPGIRPQ